MVCMWLIVLLLDAGYVVFYCFILFAIIWFDELWLLLFDLWLLVVCVYRCGTQLTTF